MNKKIFWVASYPKSGNTWMRAVLSSLFFSNEGKFNFDLLNLIVNFETLKRFEFVKSINSDDFRKLNDLKIISKYWTEAQKKIDLGKKDFTFFKTHSANMRLYDYEFTNSHNTFGLIYLVRDPRDVAISYSKHLGKNLDQIIEIMTTKGALTFTKSSYPIVISRWDEHYVSWKRLNVPKLIVKYEALLNDTRHVLNEIINFFSQNYGIRFNNSEIKIANIIKSTSFDKLQQDEKKHGFKEAKKSNFFREGQALQWKNKLNNLQLNKIENSFETIMTELDYL